ncbi:MAG: PRA1 family protein-domain-containing protein [Benniella sp.]|nr:MAG: PRA1 family protein-domain-containing protein [Benniella sp.]
MAAPAYTPLTNPFTGGFPSSEETSAAASAASSFGLGYLRKFREERLGSLRPLSEFFDRNRFSIPHGLSTVTSRFNYNLGYFQGNYLMIFLIVAAYTLFTNFALLVCVAFVIGSMFLLQRVPPEGLAVGNFRIEVSQLRIAVIVISVILFFFSSPVSTVFWIVFASGMVILAHAAVMQEGVEGDFVAVV